jgi:hypothetical protein
MIKSAHEGSDRRFGGHAHGICCQLKPDKIGAAFVLQVPGTGRRLKGGLARGEGKNANPGWSKREMGRRCKDFNFNVMQQVITNKYFQHFR